MKRIFTLLLAFTLFSSLKSFSQFCVSLGCAGAHTGLATNGALPDRSGAELGTSCYNGTNTYKQVFWEFVFAPVAGTFAQSFTPTVLTDNLDLDYIVYELGSTPPASFNCPVDGTAGTVIICNSTGTQNAATGPGVAGAGGDVFNLNAGEYYAIAIVASQAITTTFDIDAPTFDDGLGGGPQPLDGTFCPGIVLPVTLASFGSSVNDCVVNLNWSASTESQLKDYQVQVSSDGSVYHTIADMPAVNSGSTQNYSYQHANPDQGKLYYRLKMVNATGSFEYSKTIAMKMDCGHTQFVVYPNPVTNVLNVNITNSDHGTFAKLFDNSGKLIYQNRLISGSNTINMAGFAKGVYLLQLTNSTTTQNLKILK